MSGELSTALVVEILATVANLGFILLLIREKVLCWSFGIVGSLLSVWLFVDARLYSEAALYLFYALMGVWGWLRWQRREREDGNLVTTWTPARHVVAIAVAGACALGLGSLTQAFTDAERPMIDAFTTSFSFLATYLEITKTLEAWVYWFILNLTSIWLYQDRNLDIYAVLIGLYSVMSIWGFFSWQKSWRLQQQG